MCTVVLRHRPAEPVRFLALRDEFADRAFDEPGRWWPGQPDAVGGRDRTAGGTWCASEVTTGATALLVNRIERLTGTPSRGLLPLAALKHGERWVDVIDHRAMASFNLVLATPRGVTVWIWDAETLRRVEPGPGTHLVTSQGLDADDPKSRRFAPAFAAADDAAWPALVGGCEPSADDSALVVSREYVGRRYATVFGQSITAAPGALSVAWSRTPWVPGSWRDDVFTPGERPAPDVAGTTF